METYIDLSVTQVALAASLILINAGISVSLRLGIERRLLVAGLRTIIQLTLVGCVLQWVFDTDQWYIVLALLLLMTLIAGWTARQRSTRHYPEMTMDTIVAVWLSSWAITAFALLVVLRRPNHSLEHWYRPQYSIPLMGMILGNTLNGVSVGIKTLTDALYRDRDRIESALALGATRWEAANESIQDAIRTGMIPIINTMMVVGIVSLPGMMTGQMLAGTEPLSAVKYQIVILFLVAAATAVGTMAVVLFGYRHLFDRYHRLQIDRLRT